MDDGLGVIAAVISAIVGLVGLLVRLVQFVAGIGWIFSRGYREQVAKERWYCRWMVYEGVFFVVLVTLLAILAIGSILLFRASET